MDQIQVTAVANGFIVDTEFSIMHQGRVPNKSGIFVFESMKALTEWIKGNMENK